MGCSRVSEANEGASVCPARRRRSFSQAPLAPQGRGEHTLIWRIPNHTQASKTPRRDDPQKVTRVSRPPRELLGIAFSVPVAGRRNRSWLISVPLGKRMRFYAVLKQDFRSAGNGPMLM